MELLNLIKGTLKNIYQNVYFTNFAGFKCIVLALLLIFNFTPSKSQTQVDSLETALESSDSDSSKANILLELGDFYFEDNVDSALFYYLKIINLDYTSTNKSLLAAGYLNIGLCHAKQNLFKQSLESFLSALEIYLNSDDKEGISDSYYNLGNSYIALNSNDKALDNYIKALVLFEELNDQAGVVMVYNDIGNLYYMQDNYGKAKDYYMQALKVAKEIDDEEGISICYISLGNVYSDLGDYIKCIKYYEDALVIEKKLDSKLGIASIYNNLGDTYLMKGDYALALDYFFKTKKLSDEINDKDLSSLVLLNISATEIKLNKYKDAIVNAYNSLAIAKEIHSLSYQFENYLNLSSAYDSLGDYNQALVYHKLLKQVSDSIFDVERSKRVEQIDAIYQLESQQLKIENLTKSKELVESQLKSQKLLIVILILASIIFTSLAFLLFQQTKAKTKALFLLSEQKNEIQEMHDELEIQRDNLKKVNATKDKFFSIIAHDLKNPFNSIIGFTELLIDNFHDYDEEDKRRILKMIKESSTRAFNLLENLLLWARTQTGNIEFEKKEIDLAQHLTDTIFLLEIQAVKKDIKFETDINTEGNILADANMINTIFRNLLSNAIKFTQTSGKVKISIYDRGDFCEVSVVDNGIGIAKEELRKLFNIDSKYTRIGTANEQGTGLGLILCKEFIEIHGGKIKIKSEMGKGSKFIFTLPKA